MKRILLASTAIVAFAGAAAAEVTFSGDAEIGHNDTDTIDGAKGFYYSFGLTVAASAELDNGLTAAIGGDIEFDATADGANTFEGNEIEIDDLTVSLSSDTASLTFGDTKTAAEAMFSGVTNLERDGFVEDGDADDAGDDVAGILRGQMSFGTAEVGVSALVEDSSDDLKALQVAATATFGNFNVAAAIQSGESTAVTGVAGTTSDITALTVGTTVGGATIQLSTSDDGSGTSTGIGVSYPVGDITVGAFYVANDKGMEDNTGISIAYASGPLSVDALVHDGNDEDMQLNVSYDMGNGMNLYAGYRDEGSNQAEITYAGVDYDLGGGATARLSYVDVTQGRAGVATAKDEFGPGEDLKEGTTVEVKFAF
ncbi:MAG: porin [Pseudomonadota bacterium]